MVTKEYQEIVDIYTHKHKNKEFDVFQDTIDSRDDVLTAVIEPLRRAGDDEWFELELRITSDEILHELQGFINGFNTAITMLAELE